MQEYYRKHKAKQEQEQAEKQAEESSKSAEEEESNKEPEQNINESREEAIDSNPAEEPSDKSLSSSFSSSNSASSESINALGQQDKFVMFDVSYAAVTEKDDTHNLHLMVQNFQTKMTRYDVLDVFTIVFPTLRVDQKQNGGLEAKSMNLIEAHSCLTLQEVTDSHKWYASWPDEKDAPWIKENLSLSFDDIFAHMEKDLAAKI